MADIRHAKRRPGTTRRTLGHEDLEIEKLDELALLRGLVKRRGVEWVFTFIRRFKSVKQGLKRLQNEMEPLAWGMWLHLILHGENDAVRERAIRSFMEFSGKKPAEKQEHSGAGGGPLLLGGTLRIESLSEPERDALAELIRKAKHENGNVAVRR